MTGNALSRIDAKKDVSRDPRTVNWWYLLLKLLFSTMVQMLQQLRSFPQTQLVIEPKIQYHGAHGDSIEPISIMIFLPGGTILNQASNENFVRWSIISDVPLTEFLYKPIHISILVSKKLQPFMMPVIQAINWRICVDDCSQDNELVSCMILSNKYWPWSL